MNCLTMFGQVVYRYNKIVVVIGENSDQGTVFGNVTDAPYINALANAGAKLTNSFGIGHPSQPNYLYLYSGANQGVTDDNVPAGIPFTTANLGRELIDAGKTYITYSQGLPSVGFNGATSGLYVRKHNPAANWMGAGTNQIPTTTNQPFTAFPTSFSSLPDVSFVVPDLCDDGHNTCAPLNNQVKQFDTWIANNLNAYKLWCVANNSLLIVTYDEDDNAGGNNKIATLFYGANVPISVKPQTYNHYNILRTIEDAMGLSEHAGASATAVPVFINNIETPDIFMSQIEMTPSGGQPYDEFYWFNTNLASLTKTGVIFPYTGSYRFDLSAYAVVGSPSITLLIDNVVQTGTGSLTWTGTPIAINSLYIANINAGTHTIAIRISNFSGSSHIRVGLLYFTLTSSQTPFVYPALAPKNLPASGVFLGKEDFGSAKLRGFSLGSNNGSAGDATAMKATGANIGRAFVEGQFTGDVFSLMTGELTKLDNAVARATSNQYYLVPSLFMQPGQSFLWGTSAAAIAKRTSIANMWKFLANRYKAETWVGAYDLWNEPRSNFNYAEVIRWQTQMTDSIRVSDTSHVVALECISNDQWSMMLPLGYQKIIYSPHGYSTTRITHQGVQQYLLSVPVGADTIRNLMPTVVSTVPNLPAPWGVTQLSVQHDDVRIMANRFHVPIFIGEFSCINWSPINTQSPTQWTSTQWVRDNISLLETENWSWAYHAWREFEGWDSEIPSQYYVTAGFVYYRAAPFDKNNKPAGWSAQRTSTAPTITMLRTYFALNTATTCPTSGTTTASKYHFSTLCGDDSRTAAQARNPMTPWKTLAKASTYFPSLLAGDTLAFNSGEVFHGTNSSSITIQKSGTSGSPIVITSYGTGAKPIFTGFVSMSGFTNTGGIWTSIANASLLGACNVITSNGVLQQLGRFPNPTGGTKGDGYITYTSHVNDTVIISGTALPAGSWTNATAHVRTDRWLRDGGVILRQTGTRIRFANALVGNPIDGSGFFFTKDIKTLDQPGEWFYDAPNKQLKISNTSTPQVIKASSVDNLVNSANFSFITFNGIAFEGVNNACINISGGSGFKILNCDFNFSGNRSIANTSSDNITIQNCTMDNSLSDGILVNNVDGALITGNSINHNGSVVGMNNLYGAVGQGINHHGSNSNFTYNSIVNSGYAGIWTAPSSTGGLNVNITNNFIDTATSVTNDGGLIYLWNGLKRSHSGTIVNNIVLHALPTIAGNFATQPSCEGIYLDIDVSNFLIQGNTVSGTNRGIYIHFNDTINIRNNTAYDNTYNLWVQSRTTGTPSIVRRCQNKANKFIAKSTTQYTGWFETDAAVPSSDISQFFITNGCDSNYYARPINDATANNPSIRNDVTNVSFAAWRTAYPAYDANSKISQKTITNVNQFQFLYNASTTALQVTLTGNWLDVANVSYSGTITLQPYTSLVLMQGAALITPTVTWANPAAITYPTALSSTQLNATASVPGTFTYNPAPGTVLNAGTQTLSVLFIPTDGSTYAQVTKTVTIVVNKASATMVYSNLTQTYTGLPLAPTITTNPSGLTVLSTTYNGVGATPTNAGVYSIITGLTNINYTAPTISGTFTILKATATLTVSNLAQVYNGTPRSVTVVTNPVGLSGVAITYNGSPTAPTNAGTYSIVVTLTNTNYQATTVNTTLVISKKNPIISWSNPVAITYGTALSGTQLNATADVAGTFVYTPTSGTVLNAGTQLLSVNFTPTDGTNYNVINNTTVTIVVNKATATLSLSNLNQVYDGTAKSVTVTSSPVGLTVITVTYNGSSTLPINTGTYAVVASLTNSNYTATNATGNLVISTAVATLTLSGLTKTYNGSPQGVTVTTVPAGLTVITVTYNGSTTIPTNAGSYSVVATLTNGTYTATPATGTLVINKATPVITWPNPAAITYPTPLSGTQLNASANVAGSFVYVPPSGTILTAGAQTLSTTFTPTDAANYNTVSNVVVPITVVKGTATLTLSNLNQVYDATPLPVTVTTSPAGLSTVTVTYNGSATVPTNAGSYSIVATLSNANYSATGVTGTLVIAKAPATITLAGLTQTYDGTTAIVTATTEPVGLTVVTITYNGSATPPTNAGSYAIIASLSNANYTATNATGTLVVSKATPVISWSNPAAITYPTALSGTQLNATSGGVAGTFTYVPPSGTVLNAGTNTLIVNFTPTDATNYNSVNGTSVSIVVNKATATITVTGCTQEYDGNPKPVTVTTSPAGLAVIATTYDGSPTAPTAVGSYTVVSTLTNTNYTATPGGCTLVISTSAADVTITDLIKTYTGSPLSPTVTVSGGWPYDLTFNGSVTVPTNVGSYTAIATINDGIHTGADTAIFQIVKATPVITWATPAAITYGTALSGTQLNATASVAGVFTYTPVSGTVLNAGTQTLSVSFSPTDAANYNSVPVTTVSLTVNKATATLTLSNLNQVYDGTDKVATVTSSPVGLTVIAVTYDGSPTPLPNAVGTYAVVATLTNSNYTATPASGNLVISSASAGIQISDILQTYTGAPLPVTVSTNPNGLTYTVTYNASGTVPTNAGTYTVIATLTGGTYVGADTATYIISKATPVITWATPASIVYGTALSGTQLNASTGTAGTFVYSPLSGTILPAGSHTLVATFTPTDGTNYIGVVTTRTLLVTKATATITLGSLAQTYDGTPKAATATTSPVGLATISFTYNGSGIPPTAVGTYAVIATLTNSNYTATPATGNLVISASSASITISNLLQTYTGVALPITVTTNPAGLSYTVTYNGSATVPTAAGSYTVIATLTGGSFTGADTATYVIDKATPTITWSNPLNITYGTALSSTQLNATSSVAGTFVYSPVLGTVLNAGTQNLSVTFTPTDASNYNTVVKIVTITVTKATATLTLSGLTATYTGSPKAVTVTSAPVGLSGISITYNSSGTAPTNAGSYTVIASLVNDNYTASNVTGILVISKANPAVSWQNPKAIKVGTALSSIQLNATSTLPGTFTYTPPAGTILPTGTVRLSALFTPTDNVNYNSVTITVPLSVFGNPVKNYYIRHGNVDYIEIP